MKILVTSCDKNDDTYEAFHHCIEKYWPKHPEVIYSTETKVNPYYKTICKDYPLNLWTRRMRETLAEINDDRILLIQHGIKLPHNTPMLVSYDAMADAGAVYRIYIEGTRTQNGLPTPSVRR